MGYYRWADKQLQDLMAKNPTYVRSQFPGKQLGMAQSLIGSRMPGSAGYTQNVFTNQGNVMGGIERTATDSSAVLAAAAGAQGQTDQSLTNLMLQEGDWKKFGLTNLNDAYGAMADEDRIVEQQKQQEYQNLVALKSAQAANKYAKRRALWDTVSGIANFGLSAATSGIFKLPGRPNMNASAAALGGGGY